MAFKEMVSTPLFRQLWPQVRPAVWGIILLSSVINVLMFAGPLFMLQVYDRVLSSRSLETLAVLSLGLLGVFVLQAWFDMRRDRLVSRMGQFIDAKLSQPVVGALVRFSAAGAPEADAARPAKDQEQVRQFLTSNGPETLADLPWMPLFLLACFILHPWIGTLTAAGAVGLFVIGVFAERAARGAHEARSSDMLMRSTWAAAIRRNADVSAAMGMVRTLTARFTAFDSSVAVAAQVANDKHGAWLAWSRAARLGLQSAVLGLGAVLVIMNEMNAGAMIAASILTGRALQPAEQAIAHWSSLIAARDAMVRLSAVADLYQEATGTAPTEPSLQTVSVKDISVLNPAGRVALSGISFDLKAGEVLGVIGPSGSGKTTLAKVLSGIWRAQRGAIAFDGMQGATFPREAIGYLPQDASLFETSVAQNIARLQDRFESGAVIAAAKAAGAHEMIMALPQGYDTPIGGNGGGLSSGQKQRIGLARALFGEPRLVILDEPNANLDGTGELALARAIQTLKARGTIVVLIAHRSKILALCDTLLVLNQGVMQAIGPRTQVLGQLKQRRVEDPVVLLGAARTGAMS